MKKFLGFSFLCFLLAACQTGGSPSDVPTLDATVLHETAVHQATLDAEESQTPIPTQTLEPQPTQTLIPTLAHTRPAIQSPTAEKSCDQAAAAHPFDVTIPDGTTFAPGESFTKTWRLENVGSCTWTKEYAITFFSGNSLNALQDNPLPQAVEPGDAIDVSVYMQAPEVPGVYQSNWMISNAAGEIFGIGPNGDAPFWARIEVIPAMTDTPQPTPTVTSTPVVYLIGEAKLVDADQMDLDSASINPEDVTDSDFVYRSGESPAHILLTMNGTEWVLYGEEEPSYGDCQGADLSGTAISFDEDPAGVYLCYRTSNGLPGRLFVEGIEDEKFSISFLTWSVP